MFRFRHPHHFAKYQNTLQHRFMDGNCCMNCMFENDIKCPEDFESKLWDCEKDEFKKYMSIII